MAALAKGNDVMMPDQFRTERLLLRPMTTDDTSLLEALDADAEVMRFITGRALSAEESARASQEALGTRWLLFDAGDGAFHGWVGASPNGGPEEFEVGWRLCRSAWGRGLASEAAHGLTELLFANGARRVFAQTMAVNHRSRAVMWRIGLRHGRTFHLEFDEPLPGTEHGEVEYELTRSEWKSNIVGAQRSQLRTVEE